MPECGAGFYFISVGTGQTDIMFIFSNHAAQRNVSTQPHSNE